MKTPVSVTYYEIESGQHVLERHYQNILAHSRHSGLVIIDSLAALGSDIALFAEDVFVSFTPAPRGRLSGLAERLAA